MKEEGKGGLGKRGKVGKRKKRLGGKTKIP
jgi:hypothetical protein